MLKILAIDSSHARCSVALTRRDGSGVELRESAQDRQHARQMLPMIEELLASQQLRLKDRMRLPSSTGSFTGLRIGAGVAQGLAFGAGLPVVGVSSLAVMAMKAWRSSGQRHLLVCLNAREGEVYSGAYTVEEGDALLSGEEKVGAPEPGIFAKLPPEYEWYAVGDGWQYAAQLQSAALRLQDDGMDYVSDAATLCHLAQTRLTKGLSSAAAAALPVYLKEQMDYQD